MRFIRPTIFTLIAALAACGKDSTGPVDQYSIAVQAGDQQFATKNSSLGDPLQVVVTDPTSKAPVRNITVTWTIVQGTGATLTSTTSTTNSKGVASTNLKLADLGTYIVEASPPKILGSAARFTAKAVDPPAITSISPTTAKAGDTVTVNGSNFSTIAEENIVLFGGFRGKVTTASTTQLRVVVPLCVTTRNPLVVQAMLGAVQGNQSSIAVTGSGTLSSLQLARGEVRTFTDPNELSCFLLPDAVVGLTMLLIPQNYSQVVGSLTTYEITGQRGGSLTTDDPPVLGGRTATTNFANEWELQLRTRERGLLSGQYIAPRPQHTFSNAACPPAPVVGDRCNFQVSDKDNKFTSVTAEVKAVSQHAIIYQDVNAPANGLTTSDFSSLGSMFDDPIYDTDIATYGSVSDMDGNGKVVILLTPVVNALTPKGSSGFVAGFFYACDLLPSSQCSGTNSGEIFYALAPDPAGQFSDAHTRDVVMRALPPVLAHEFMHMINFGARGNRTIDALWLSEGMAHNAEDVVGDEYERRGDLANASLFRSQNTVRGNRFLRATATTSMLSEEDASLELRGGAWLFVKYLQGRFGNSILQKMTSSTLSSVANVTAQTGKSWSSLLSDFSVAIYADDNPELSGATVNAAFTFPNMNTRTRLVNSDGSYPIKPTTYGFIDFTHRESLEASSMSYIAVQSANGANKLNLTFTGLRGGSFAINAAPQMTVMRIR